jgi:hypothetical protein
MRAREFLVKEQRTDEFIQALAPAAMAIGRAAATGAGAVARGIGTVGSKLGQAAATGAEKIGSAVAQGAQKVGQAVVQKGVNTVIDKATGQEREATPQELSAQQKDMTSNIGQLKSAGLNINPQQALQALSKADQGQQMNPTDQKNIAPIADKVAGVLKDPKLTAQLKNLISQTPQ